MRVPHIHRMVQGRSPLDTIRSTSRVTHGAKAASQAMSDCAKSSQASTMELDGSEPTDAGRHDRVFALHQTNDLDARLAHVGLDHLEVRRRLGAIQRLVRVLVGVVEPQVPNSLESLPAACTAATSYTRPPTRRTRACSGAPEVPIRVFGEVRERGRVVDDRRLARRVPSFTAVAASTHQSGGTSETRRASNKSRCTTSVAASARWRGRGIITHRRRRASVRCRGGPRSNLTHWLDTRTSRPQASIAPISSSHSA